MYLQLAERGRYFPVRGYSRRGGRVKAHKRHLSEAEPNYIFVPDFTGQTNGIWVREDNFDNLSTPDFISLMNNLERFQPQDGTMSGGLLNKLFPGREARQETRQEKREAKVERKEAKTDLIKAKAGAIESGQTTPTTGGQILNNVLGAATAIFGKGQPVEATGGTATVNPEIANPKKWYQKPVTWIVGGTLLVGGAVLAKKKGWI